MKKSLSEKDFDKVNQACVRIRQEAFDNPIHRGMGTTLTILLIEDGIAHFFPTSVTVGCIYFEMVHCAASDQRSYRCAK